MDISTKDLALIFALEEDPFISITKLAEMLKLSRPTVKKRMENLKKQGILGKPIALYQPENLGLERKHIFAEVSTQGDLKKLEKACEEHPYTRYRVRTFGGTFGLYMQFEIPPNTLQLLNEFMLNLQESKFIINFKIFESCGTRTVSFPDLSKFNVENLTWDFSWDKWFKSLKSYSSEINNLEKEETDFSVYKPSHLQVLRKISSDASINQSELKDVLGLSKTEAHRSYKYVMDKYIDRVRLIYDRESFNLTETYLAISTFIGEEKQGQIYNQMKENPPPFHISVDMLKNYGIIIWGNMSTSQATDFAFSSWKSLNNANIYILNTKKGGSRMYWFYPNNFDFKEQYWKISREYMVDEPLSRLDRYAFD
ncbi:MAG: winged helix-turn-helix transcriptional regulator [Candidatus Thorarchaeota archaeon]